MTDSSKTEKKLENLPCLSVQKMPGITNFESGVGLLGIEVYFPSTAVSQEDLGTARLSHTTHR